MGNAAADIRMTTEVKYIKILRAKGLDSVLESLEGAALFYNKFDAL